MNIIWITSLFPSGNDTTKGIYLYRTVRKLSEYFNITTVVIYPAVPPILKMLEKPKDAIKTLKYWKKNFPKHPVPPEGIKKESIYYVRYWRLPRRFFNHYEGYFAYYKSKSIFKRILTKDSIIHSNWIFPSGQLAKILNDKYDVPYITSLLGTDVHNLKAGTKYWTEASAILSQSSMISSVSKKLISRCREEKIDINDSKVIYINNIYDEKRFIIKSRNSCRDILGLDKGRKIIFFAGGLVPVKNVSALISAFASIRNSEDGVQLLLAGAGSERGELENLALKMNCNKEVLFLGNLSEEKIIDYFNASDVFCLPSKNEGTPNVIVESLLCGLPVVASNVGGIPDVIKNDQNGYIFNPNDTNELERYLQKALMKEWNRQLLRESVSSFFTSETIKQYGNMYKTLSN